MKNKHFLTRATRKELEDEGFEDDPQYGFQLTDGRLQAVRMKTRVPYETDGSSTPVTLTAHRRGSSYLVNMLTNSGIDISRLRLDITSCIKEVMSRITSSPEPGLGYI